MPSSISIIIPTLNEAERISATLQSLRDSSVTPLEIIVVDAGSRDETCALARQYQGRVMTNASPGRATQMNLGAQTSRGDLLVFLHADTVIPPFGLSEMQEKMERNARVAGGAFSRRYDSPSRFLQWTCQLADWRGSLWGWFLGDQVIFVRRTAFDALQGFRDMPAFEDLDFSRRLIRFGKVIRLRSRVLSSARRFQRQGPLRTTWKDFQATWQFCRGRNVHDILKGLKS